MKIRINTMTVNSVAQQGESDDPLIAALLRLAAVKPTGRETMGTVESLLAQGRQLVGGDGGVVLLADGDPERLTLAGASGPRSRVVAETAIGEVDSLATSLHGRLVVTLPPAGPAPWRRYGRVARGEGFRGLRAAPLVAEGETLGVYVLHYRRPPNPSTIEDRAVTTLARMAAESLITAHLLEERATRVDQLQHALNSRVLIEQAKGVVAARAGIDPTSAFERMRAASRASGRPLASVAEDVMRRVCDHSTVHPGPTVPYEGL